MKTTKIEKATNLTENEINLIIQRYERINQFRDIAYLTVILETGLSPNTVKQLRVENLEKNSMGKMPVPCKISLHGIKKSQSEQEPIFIGQKAVDSLNKLLNEQKPNALLFSIRNNPNEQIEPSEQNRRFQRYASLTLQSYKTKEELDQISLYSLIRFYNENARSYLKKIRDSKEKHDDDYFQEIYENEVLPNLEPKTWEITKLRKRLEKTELMVEILSQIQYQQTINLLTKSPEEAKKELALTPQAHQRIRVEDQKTPKKSSERLFEISKMLAESLEGKRERLDEFCRQLNSNDKKN